MGQDFETDATGLSTRALRGRTGSYLYFLLLNLSLGAVHGLH